MNLIYGLPYIDLIFDPFVRQADRKGLENDYTIQTAFRSSYANKSEGVHQLYRINLSTIDSVALYEYLPGRPRIVSNVFIIFFHGNAYKVQHTVLIFPVLTQVYCSHLNSMPPRNNLISKVFPQPDKGDISLPARVDFFVS